MTTINGIEMDDGVDEPSALSPIEVPVFELHRYNPRRAARGVEAAEVKVTWKDGETELLWMSKADLLDNLRACDESKGLRDALEAYATGQPFPTP